MIQPLVLPWNQPRRLFRQKDMLVWNPRQSQQQVNEILILYSEYDYVSLKEILDKNLILGIIIIVIRITI